MRRHARTGEHEQMIHFYHFFTQGGRGGHITTGQSESELGHEYAEDSGKEEGACTRSKAPPKRKAWGDGQTRARVKGSVRC